MLSWYCMDVIIISQRILGYSWKFFFLSRKETLCCLIFFYCSQGLFVVYLGFLILGSLSLSRVSFWLDTGGGGPQCCAIGKLLRIGMRTSFGGSPRHISSWVPMKLRELPPYFHFGGVRLRSVLPYKHRKWAWEEHVYDSRHCCCFLSVLVIISGSHRTCFLWTWNPIGFSWIKLLGPPQCLSDTEFRLWAASA